MNNTPLMILLQMLSCWYMQAGSSNQYLSICVMHAVRNAIRAQGLEPSKVRVNAYIEQEMGLKVADVAATHDVYQVLDPKRWMIFKLRHGC